MRAFRAVLPILVLLGLMLPGIVPVQAAPPAASPARVASATFQTQAGVRLVTTAGFGEDGSYAMGAWFPVRVMLDNPAGAGDMRVRVEVDLSGGSGGSGSSSVGTYARDVDLPSPSRKQVTLYTFAGNFTHTVRVRLLQGEKVIASANVSVDPQEPVNGAIVGVVSSDASLLNVYEGEEVGNPEQPPSSMQFGGPMPPTQEAPRARIAHIQPDDIPPLTAGLNSLAALVVDDVDTGALSQEQREAVASWVGRGGTLVVSARSGGANTLAGFADLLPVSASGTRTLSSLKGIADLVGTPLEASGQVIVPDAQLRADLVGAPRTLAAQDGVPLVAIRDLGRGQVVYLAVSPGADPLKGWDGLVPLLKRVLAEHPVTLAYGGARAGGYGPYNQLFSTYGTIFDLPGLDLPEPLLLAAFMLIYIVLVGPVNYVILKRMRRAELAWVTIPVMVAVFAALAYFIGLQSKGGELLTIRGNVVHTTPGLSTAETQQYLGVFSPIRRTYRLEIGSDATASEIDPYGYNYSGGGSGGKLPTVLASGSTTTIENVNVNTWSLRSFMAESTVRVESPLEADLRLGDNLIEGTVRNRGEVGLEDVVLVRGQAIQYIGFIGPGNQTPVKLNIAHAPFHTTSPVPLLPLPPGVEDPSQSGGYYGGGQDSNQQRDYNRRVQMLSTALEPLLVNEPPSDFTVLAVAWGPSPPSEFRVLDRTTRTEDLNVWTSRLQVAGGDGGQGRITQGTLPAMQYVPDDNPAWKPFDGSEVSLNPFTTVQFRLPQGTQPGSLTLEYEARTSLAGNPLEVLAFNVRTGAWDRLAEISGGQSQQTSVPINNPLDYTGPGGDVTLRIAPTAGSTATRIAFDTFTLSLNDTQ
ncbi:MAG TPA: hypothetical protein VFH60_09585 [Chloroflexia bacterium]|nr:hypothetical protein [Chloroflexia bacterium]